MIIRVNLKDHSYQHVTKTLMYDFESTSLKFTQAKKFDETSNIRAWIFQVHFQELLEEEKLKTNRAVDDDYVLQPFPKHSFDPHV